MTGGFFSSRHSSISSITKKGVDKTFRQAEDHIWKIRIDVVTKYLRHNSSARACDIESGTGLIKTVVQRTIKRMIRDGMINVSGYPSLYSLTTNNEAERPEG